MVEVLSQRADTHYGDFRKIMYNKCLEPLLSNEPKKTITKFGIRVRKLMYPLLAAVVPHTLQRKVIVVGRGNIPKGKPVIFASVHGFAEDAQAMFIAANRSVYILNGSVPLVMNTPLGILNWIAGMIVVCRDDKESRKAAKAKMIYAINNGASVALYPEGTWNKSPNQVISGLFLGVYAVAKATGASVVPVAHQREEDMVYSIVGDAFDISGMEQADAMEIVKEKLATLKWELIETYSNCKRSDLPYGAEADRYWKNHIDSLMTEVPFYDYELEKHAKYVDKGVTLLDEAFGFFKKLKPNMNTAFLYRGNERYWNKNN